MGKWLCFLGWHVGEWDFHSAGSQWRDCARCGRREWRVSR